MSGKQDKCPCGALMISPLYMHSKYESHQCKFHTSLHCKVCKMLTDIEKYLVKWAKFDQYLRGVE